LHFETRFNTEARGEEMGDECYDYDVFVSHSWAERGWVRDELLPRLERVWLEEVLAF